MYFIIIFNLVYCYNCDWISTAVYVIIVLCVAQLYCYQACFIIATICPIVFITKARINTKYTSGLLQLGFNFVCCTSSARIYRRLFWLDLIVVYHQTQYIFILNSLTYKTKSKNKIPLNEKSMLTAFTARRVNFDTHIYLRVAFGLSRTCIIRRITLTFHIYSLHLSGALSLQTVLWVEVV